MQARWAWKRGDQFEHWRCQVCYVSGRYNRVLAYLQVYLQVYLHGWKPSETWACVYVAMYVMLNDIGQGQKSRYIQQ